MGEVLRGQPSMNLNLFQRSNTLRITFPTNPKVNDVSYYDLRNSPIMKLQTPPSATLSPSSAARRIIMIFPPQRHPLPFAHRPTKIADSDITECGRRHKAKWWRDTCLWRSGGNLGDREGLRIGKLTDPRDKERAAEG
jgi:hypothetical protein